METPNGTTSERSVVRPRQRWTRATITVALACVVSFAGAASPAFVQAPCPFVVEAPDVDGSTVVCGTVQVSSDRSNVDEGVVTLHVAIVRATTPAPGESIVYLEGGPGGGATATVPTWWVRSSLREHGDIVVLDARGTGYSTPSLDCFEWYVDTVRDPTAACRSRLHREGIDLSTHRSRVLAADVVDVVDALDLSRAVLFGSSYGTRLALTLLRDHPGRWTAAILDGVYPPHLASLETQPVAGYRALVDLLSACASDPSCGAAFPEARTPGRTLASMVAALNTRNLVDDYGDRWTGTDVYYLLEGAAYATDALAWIPAVVVAAARRDADSFTRLVDRIAGPGTDDSAYEADLRGWLRWMTGSTSASQLTRFLRAASPTAREVWWARAEGLADLDAEGVYDSVECAEEVPFNDPQRVRDAASIVGQALSFLVSDALSTFDDCNAWNVPAEDPSFRLPVRTDVPVLLVSGRFDPVTPPWYADDAASYMSNGHAFTFPGMGHGTIDVHPCPTQIALAFLTDPSVAPDSSCIASMPGVAFELR